MTAISKDTFQFLKDLSKNNNRDWFNEHKPRYQKAKAEFEVFVDALIQNITAFDESIGHHKAKDCIFRIYRDVRFSKDKSPYKVHMGAHVTSAAKRSEIHSRAGYYIHIGPGESMLAGGAYLPQGPWLKAIRQEISYNADGLKQVLNAPDFKKYFGEMEGEKLKTAPRDYEKDHPEIELLKHKSFLASHQLSDKEVTSPGFLDHATQVFEALYPFDNFLNSVLDQYRKIAVSHSPQQGIHIRHDRLKLQIGCLNLPLSSAVVSSKKGLNILMVDDNIDTIRSLVNHLRTQGGFKW